MLALSNFSGSGRAVVFGGNQQADAGWGAKLTWMTKVSMRYGLLLAAALFWFGCDDGETSSESVEMPPAERVIKDAAPPDAALTDAALPDAAVSDAAISMGPDAAPPMGIQTCSQACGRYADCLATDIFETDQACLDACRRGSREAIPEAWFACLDTVSCDDIQNCPVPDPVPLDCAQVCGAVESCGLGSAYAEHCEALCEMAGFLECGEALVDEACEAQAFETCVITDVLPACGAYCAAALECNLIPPEDCAGQCVARQLSDDPLTRARSASAAICVGGATQCLQTQRCVFPDAPSGRGRTCIQACTGLQACEFPPDLDTCIADCDAELAFDPVGHQFFVDCIVDFVAPAECAPEALEACAVLVDPAQGPGPCDLLCEGLTLCTDSPPANCAATCAGALIDPATAGAWRRQAPCGRLDNCADFEACLAAGGPDAICNAVCDGLAACGLGGDACADDCGEGFDSPRVLAIRACVDASDGCPALTECLPGPPLPCAAYCDRLDACQLGAGLDCVVQCEALSLQTPEQGADTVGCVLTAPICQGANPFEPVHAVDQCTFNPLINPDARACLNRCRFAAECVGGGDVAACAQACGAGLQGEAALRFAAERDCWAAPAAPTCAELAECPVDEVVVDCAGFCATVTGCGIPAEACLERCADAPDLDAVACVLGAGDCTDTAVCVDFEIPDPSPACATFCAARSACDPTIDALRCALDCAPDDLLAARAACAQVTACASVDVCLALDGAPNPECEEACAACDIECVRTCTGRLASPRADEAILAEAPACLAENACNAAACFPVPTACTDACDLLADCAIPLAEDPIACVAANCPNGAPTDLFRGAIECAERHLRVGCNEESYLPCLFGIDI